MLVLGRDERISTTAGENHANGGVPRRVEILGCPVDALDMRSTVERCIELIEDGHAHRHVSVNAAKVIQCADDRHLAEFVRASDIVSADGQSIVWAARWLGRPLPERVAGIDLMRNLIAEAEQRGLSVYLLGGREQVLTTAISRLRESHPELRIAGAQHGYFSAEQEPEVARKVRHASPDVLFVAMSSPRKEEWIDRNLDRLGIRFVMGVGGAIDVIAGERVRAPAWAQRSGLEWTFRLAQEPRRMWRRYLVGNLRFAWLVARERARIGLERRRDGEPA